MGNIQNFFLMPKKSLGQNFLINRKIAEIEAAHAPGKVVLEIGPGYGTLTSELCKKAKKVIAVEIDENLCNLLRNEIKAKNLKIINKDFLAATSEEMELDAVDIVISNIPYSLSSKTIEFLARNGLQAVLCMQKEFVAHMLAKAGTDKYSKLSVMTQLFFSATKLINVSRGNFRPVPKVDSCVIYLKPKNAAITQEEMKIIGLIMQHKKKTLRNAVLDSHEKMGVDEKRLREIAGAISENELRPFKLEPEELLKIAREIVKMVG